MKLPSNITINQNFLKKNRAAQPLPVNKIVLYISPPLLQPGLIWLLQVDPTPYATQFFNQPTLDIISGGL